MALSIGQALLDSHRIEPAVSEDHIFKDEFILYKVGPVSIWTAYRSNVCAGYVLARARVCARVCVRACARACACVCAVDLDVMCLYFVILAWHTLRNSITICSQRAAHFKVMGQAICHPQSALVTQREHWT